MDYGAVIKRSWEITWRYKALWVLGIFAGVSGCSAGGTGNSGGSDWASKLGSGSGTTPDLSNIGRSFDRVTEYLPLLIAAGILLFLIGLVWWVMATAARGGLVTGVNAVEDGSPRPLGDLWSAGFRRFWSLVGLDILLQVPVLIVLAVVGISISVPVVAAIVRGGEPGAEIIAPVCGSIAVGVPLLVVGGFVLGIMRLIGQRYVMLGGQGAVTAAKNGWLFLRARLKDTAIMWLINAGLNLAASFVLVIPVVILGAGAAIAVVPFVAVGNWGPPIAFIAAAVLVGALMGCVYSAIWGTYTSALWTLFFRSVAGTGAAASAPEEPAYAPTSPNA